MSDVENAWEPEYSFSVLTGEKEIYRFLLHFSYASVLGIIGLIVSLCAGGWLVLNFFSMDLLNKLFYFLVFSVYVIINPVILKYKAKKQVESSGYFSRPLKYELSEKGIAVWTGKNTANRTRIKWEMVDRVREYGGMVIVHMSKANAFIWPEDQMGDVQKVKACIQKHVESKKIKFRG